jgi:hypothetical protein
MGIHVVEIAADAPHDGGALECVTESTLFGLHVAVASAVGLPDPFLADLDADAADRLLVACG